MRYGWICRAVSPWTENCTPPTAAWGPSSSGMPAGFPFYDGEGRTLHVPPELIAVISRQGRQAAPAGVRALVDELLVRHGEGVQAIVFYGSCFRTGDDGDGLVDLYVLVDGYRSLSRTWMQAYLYKVVRPTVFYLEVPYEGRVVRCKYAVLSLSDFERGTTRRWFHSYLWGRFAQPTGVLYARGDPVRERVQAAFARAVLTFITRVLPLMPPGFEARQLWQRGLSLSYRAELRAEPPGAVARLFDAAPDYYEDVTRVAVKAIPFPVEVVDGTPPIRYRACVSAWARYAGHLAWGIRLMQGKMLSVLRLSKGLFTFRGGIDYILWKIERHSGERVELTPRLQRYPVLARGVIFWRLYRRGAFR